MSDLVGVWKFDAGTRKYLSKRHGYRLTTNQVILRGNGTFSMVNMPIYRGYGSKKGPAFYSGSGTWDVSKSQGLWIVALWFDEVDGRKTYSERIEGLPHEGFHIRRERPPYLLYRTLGDPDLQQQMFLERTADDPNAAKASGSGQPQGAVEKNERD